MKNESQGRYEIAKDCWSLNPDTRTAHPYSSWVLLYPYRSQPHCILKILMMNNCVFEWQPNEKRPHPFAHLSTQFHSLRWCKNVSPWSISHFLMIISRACKNLCTFSLLILSSFYYTLIYLNKIYYVIMLGDYCFHKPNFNLLYSVPCLPKCTEWNELNFLLLLSPCPKSKNKMVLKK